MIRANKVEHSETDKQNTVPANLRAEAALFPFFAADTFRAALSRSGDDVVGLGLLEVGSIEVEDMLAGLRLYS
jgi:hypothetical protein